MLCHYCEQEKEGLPFRCNYCGNFFCSEHRLPENHSCPRVGGPKQPGYATVPSVDRAFRGNSAKDQSRLPTVRSSRSRFRLSYAGVFSATEQKHMLIAVALVSLVGLSMINFGIGVPPIVILVLVSGFVVSFVGHELAHKFTAQRNGMWAEFRTNLYGIMMTVISIVPFFFKFLAPGQVNIVGNGNKATMGMVAFVGPGFNTGLGWICLVIAHIPVLFLSWLGFLAEFNGIMALWNLLPFGTFDGTKIFEWDKIRWGFLIGASVALLVLVFVPWP